MTFFQAIPVTFYQAILSSFIAAIFAGIVIWFIHGRLNSLALLFARSRMARQVPKNLGRYLDNLTRRTLEISHPWMREGQTLGDILVPVTLLVGEHRADLRAYFAEQFQKDRAPRVVVTGTPGSGKSIALGEIARFLPTLERDQPLAPVLLTFSDLKGVNRKEDLESVIGDKLRRDQFMDARPNSDTSAHFIEESLYEGNIALLIDGYDELDREQRTATSKFVCDFLATYRKVPAALASRSAVYEREEAFRSIATGHGIMAPLTPLAVTRFVSQWRFESGKSGPELQAHINLIHPLILPPQMPG
jgi:hypothetical protein